MQHSKSKINQRYIIKNYHATLYLRVMELLSNLDLNVFYAIQRKSHVICRYVMNFTFERRVDKKKRCKGEYGKL